MTIDEAIEIYELRANTHEREAEYHRPLGYSHEAIANAVEMQAREERQIAKWLKELKEVKAEQTEPNYSEKPNNCEDKQTEGVWNAGFKTGYDKGYKDAQKVNDRKGERNEADISTL